MKVLLLQDIKNFGKKGDIKEVSIGYAKNFLIPKKLAKIVTDRDLKEIEKQKQLAKEREERIREGIEKIANELNKKDIHFYVETGDKDEVYNSIKKEDILKELEKMFLKIVSPKLVEPIVKKTKINLERSLKTLGIHKIEVEVGHKKFMIEVVLNKIK